MSSLNNSGSTIAKIRWELGNFQNLGSELQTKHFSMPNNEKNKFQLSCYPNKDFSGCGTNHTFIYLYLQDSDQKQPSFRYSISLLNANGAKFKNQEGTTTYVTGRFKHSAFFQIFRNYLLDQELLVDGKLIIYCEVGHFSKHEHGLINSILKIEEISNKNSDPKMHECKKCEVFNTENTKLTEDYQSLLESGKFSDASLIVGDKKLMVHKNILSARCSVFAAMFENDCKEKLQNRVEIIDISVEVCEQMLSYIYTGKIPDLNKYAADLFAAADKYQLDNLKTACEEHLSSKLEVDTAAKTLLVADMHHATVLKASCIEFIIKHGEKVIASSDWNALIKARPELGFELFERMFKKN